MKKAGRNVALVLALSLAASGVSSAAPANAATTKPAFAKKLSTVTVGSTYTYKVKRVKKNTKLTWKITAALRPYVSFKKNSKVYSETTTATNKTTSTNKIYIRKNAATAKTGYVKVTATGANGKKYTISNKIKVKKKTATTSGTTTSDTLINSVNVINNTDFTVTVSATIGGKQLADMLKADVESALQGSRLVFTCEENGMTLTATYASYSADSNLITYKMDADSIVKLQPSKNNGKIGSADGTYTITGTNVQIASGLTTTYVEALVGNSVSGYIYDSITREPIKNVKVTAATSSDSRSDMTDANGYYYIPVTAGKCTVTAETVDAQKELYFVTNTEDVKVSANNKTACNMYLDLYNREEFFINGSVTNAETSDKVENAIVTLYEVKSNGAEEKIAAITTDKTGNFVFANSQAKNTTSYQTIATKYGLNEENGDSRVKTFSYNEGLDRNKTYKVVIEKGLSTKNITDVYESKVSEKYQFDNVQEWNLGDVKLTPIKQTKNLTINAKWETADYMPEGATAVVTVNFCYEAEDGVWKTLKEDDITVDVDKTDRTFSYDLAAKKFFGEDGRYPTLPSGKYYIVLNDKNQSTTIVTQAVNLTAGNTVSVPEMVIAEGKSTSVAISCTDKDSASLANIVEGGTVQVVKDNEGTLFAQKTPVEVQCDFYQKIGNDKIYIGTISKELTYSKANNAISISGTVGINRTIAGANYIVAPIQSYIQASDLTFAQTDAAGDTVQLKCAGAANINYIKVDNEKLFNLEDGAALPDSFIVDSIAVLDANDKKIGTYTYEDGLEITKAKLISTGVPVPSDAVAFKGLAPGNYKVCLDLVDFEPVVSNSFKVIDFESVTANVANNIDYTQKIAISGTITADGIDIQDKDITTTDAFIMLYDEKGVIVGATTYGTTKDNTKYAFVNGENAYLEDGKTYTLVVRSAHNAGQIAFETQETTVTVADKTNKKVNLEVVKGANAGITIGARDENNNYLKNAVVSLVDSTWSKFHSFVFDLYGATKENSSEINWIGSMIFGAADSSIGAVVANACIEDPNLVGIYPVGATDDPSEWKIVENLPGNTYTAYIAADEVDRLEIPGIQVANGQHVTKIGNVLKLTAGVNAVTVTLSYSHLRDVGVAVPFDMIEVLNSKGEVVVRKYIPDTKINTITGTYPLKDVKVLVPNIADTYTFKVYSNESFIGSQDVNVQGTATQAELRLSRSATN